MFPELIRYGDFVIHTYGVALTLALLLALWTAARLAKNDGLPSERIWDLGLWLLIAGLLGSKLLLVVVDADYWANPMRIFSLDFLRSGGVYYGGFLGGLVALWLLIKRYKLPFWKVADALVPGVALGQAIGRQGCFAAGCCWGKPTNLPWGIHFTTAGHNNTGVPVSDEFGNDLFLHPTQLYESFFMLGVFVLLYWMHGKKKFDGQILISYMVLYPVFRFVNEFFRADARGGFGIFSTSQIISLLVGVAALIFLILRWRKVSQTMNL